MSRRGAASRSAPGPETEGLDALDRDRAASLADEGGAAGAVVESQEQSAPRVASAIATAATVTAAVLAAVAVFCVARR